MRTDEEFEAAEDDRRAGALFENLSNEELKGLRLELRDDRRRCWYLMNEAGVELCDRRLTMIRRLLWRRRLARGRRLLERLRRWRGSL